MMEQKSTYPWNTYSTSTSKTYRYSSILEVIDPKKDVDGFHAYNVGRMVTNLDSFVPCTPLGVMEMFREYNIELEGRDVIVGRAREIGGKA